MKFTLNGYDIIDIIPLRMIIFREFTEAFDWVANVGCSVFRLRKLVTYKKHGKMLQLSTRRDSAQNKHTITLITRVITLVFLKVLDWGHYWFTKCTLHLIILMSDCLLIRWKVWFYFMGNFTMVLLLVGNFTDMAFAFLRAKQQWIFSNVG